MSTWTAKLAIQELIHRYADGVNRADWDQVRAVFAPHAVWESPVLQLHFESGPEFCDFLAGSDDGVELLVQTCHNTIVRLASPTKATATTTIHEISRGINQADGALGAKGAEIAFEDYGIYHDEVELIDGEWLFVHRVFVPVYLEVGVKGEVPTQRTGLAALR
jgi:hypothetical protein